MFAVETSKGENIAIEDDTPEVAYHLFRIICLLQGNPGPQCGYDEVNVTYMYYGIIIAVNIRTYFKAIYFQDRSAIFAAAPSYSKRSVEGEGAAALQ